METRCIKSCAICAGKMFWSPTPHREHPNLRKYLWYVWGGGRSAKETFEKTFLIYGRVCIRVEGHKLINEEIMLSVCGNSFSMEVREELPSRDSPAVIMARDDGLF